MTYTTKLILVFIGLFVLMTAGGIIMAYLNNMPIVLEEQLAEGFYYGAIGFAVYHLFTRNKQAKAKKEPEAAPAEETALETAAEPVETAPEKNSL